MALLRRSSCALVAVALAALAVTVAPQAAAGSLPGRAVVDQQVPGSTSVTPGLHVAGGMAALVTSSMTTTSGGTTVATPVGTAVTVQFRPDGWVPWITVARTSVRTAGSAQARVRLSRSGTWRLVVGSAPSAGVFVDVLLPRTTGPQPVVSGPLTRTDVPYSFRPGCPTGPSDLRRLTVSYYDFDGRVRRGDIIVRKDAVADLVIVFSKAWAARFPIRHMSPVDVYYTGGSTSPSGSDLRSMGGDNTSAFNCRPVTGNPYRLSTHSNGTAIDINPAENPYVTTSHVYPAGSDPYLHRSPNRTGMVVPGGTIERAMTGNGWPWGARWSKPDYQHFSSNGG